MPGDERRKERKKKTKKVMTGEERGKEGERGKKENGKGTMKKRHETTTRHESKASRCRRGYGLGYGLRGNSRIRRAHTKEDCRK